MTRFIFPSLIICKWIAVVGYIVTGETVNYISKGSKLAQKEYKMRHDWVGKLIHWELCKKLDEWYMYKWEFALENEMHQIWGDLEIQTDHSIYARRYD